MRLRFYRDLQPLPYLRCGPSRVLQVSEMTLFDLGIDCLQLGTHVRQLLLERIYRQRHLGRGPIVRDQ
ncbi:hypothetical protein XM53_13425 [Roseovarius atlanticus]|uniref:Uncharacterized protein n=1 Tax=Roseovarius atlanticus TaxID=1641875 RepID=A0A0T5NSZ0_9RHOB|nr:hypothetical protein XM53_13425 [Roseovarius atlanticus]